MNNIQKHFKRKADCGLRAYASGGIPGFSGMTDGENELLKSANDRLMTLNAQPTATQPTATQPTATQPTATQPTATQPAVDPFAGMSRLEVAQHTNDPDALNKAFDRDQRVNAAVSNVNRSGLKRSERAAYGAQLGLLAAKGLVDPAEMEKNMLSAGTRTARTAFGAAMNKGVGLELGFQAGGTVDPVEALLAKTKAQYGGVPAPQTQAPQPVPTPAPQPAPQPQAKQGMFAGLKAALDPERRMKAAGFAQGGKVGVDPAGFIHGPKGVDKVPARVAETGEPIRVGAGERIVNKQQNAALEQLAQAQGVSLDEYLEGATGEPVGPTMKKGLRGAINGGIFVDANGVTREIPGEPQQALPPPKPGTSVAVRPVIDRTGGGSGAYISSEGSIDSSARRIYGDADTRSGRPLSPEARAYMAENDARTMGPPKPNLAQGGPSLWSKLNQPVSVGNAAKGAARAAGDVIRHPVAKGLPVLGVIGGAAAAEDAYDNGLNLENSAGMIAGADSALALAGKANPVTNVIGSGAAGYAAGKKLERAYIDDPRAGQSFNDFKVERMHDALKGNPVGDWILDKTGVGEAVALNRKNAGALEDLQRPRPKAKPAPSVNPADKNYNENFDSTDRRTPEARAAVPVWDAKSMGYLNDQGVNVGGLRRNVTDDANTVNGNGPVRVAQNELRQINTGNGRVYAARDKKGQLVVTGGLDRTPEEQAAATKSGYDQAVAQAAKDKVTLRQMQRDRFVRDTGADITDPGVQRNAAFQLARMNGEDAAAAQAAQHAEVMGLRKGELGLRERALQQQNEQFGMTLKSQQDAAARAAQKEGLAEFDAQVKNAGFEGDEAVKFADWFKGNYAGRRQKIGDSVLDVPGFEDMSGDERRAHMTNAKAQYAWVKQLNAHEKDGKTSMGIPKNLRERKITFDDVQKRKDGLFKGAPVLYSDNPDSPGLLGEGGLINRLWVPAQLGGQDNRMVDEVDDKGRPIRSWLRGNTRGEQGPWGNLDTAAYIDSLTRK